MKTSIARRGWVNHNAVGMDMEWPWQAKRRQNVAVHSAFVFNFLSWNAVMSALC